MPVLVWLPAVQLGPRRAFPLTVPMLELLDLVNAFLQTHWETAPTYHMIKYIDIPTHTLTTCTKGLTASLARDLGLAGL